MSRRFEGLRQTRNIERRLRLIGSPVARVIDDGGIGGDQKQVIRLRLARHVREVVVAQYVLLGECPIRGNVANEVLLLDSPAGASGLQPCCVVVCLVGMGRRREPSSPRWFRERRRNSCRKYDSP